MKEKVNLKLDWCSYKAAKYAVEHWHYSRCMPKSKMVRVGAWENGKYIGCIIFSYGATPQIGSPYKLSQYEICELTRVALTEHETQVSKLLSFAIKMLKKQSPGVRLIVSFADMEHNHYGIIYQATNWVYTGTTKPGRVGFVVRGKKTHTRTIGSMPGGVQSLEWVKNHIDRNAVEWIGVEKHRYLMPLDDDMRKQIEPLRKPYPKRGQGEIDNAPQSNEETGGARPTCPLLDSV